MLDYAYFVAAAFDGLRDLRFEAGEAVHQWRNAAGQAGALRNARAARPRLLAGKIDHGDMAYQPRGHRSADAARRAGGRR